MKIALAPPFIEFKIFLIIGAKLAKSSMFSVQYLISLIQYLVFLKLAPENNGSSLQVDRA